MSDCTVIYPLVILWNKWMLFYQSAGFQIMVWFGYMVLDTWQSLFYGDLENYVGRPDDGFFCHTDSITSIVEQHGLWLADCLFTPCGCNVHRFTMLYLSCNISNIWDSGLLRFDKPRTELRIRRHACPIFIVLVSALAGIHWDKFVDPSVRNCQYFWYFQEIVLSVSVLELKA